MFDSKRKQEKKKGKLTISRSTTTAFFRFDEPPPPFAPFPFLARMIASSKTPPKRKRAFPFATSID
jgi:hypothetical protein